MATVWRRTQGEILESDGQTQVFHTYDLYPSAVFCSFCGAPRAIAWWQGWQGVSVCRDCCLDAVPKLLGDGLAGEDLVPLARLRQELARVARTFWRAVGMALRRVGQVRGRGRGAQ
jgi:hypothetical protein